MQKKGRAVDLEEEFYTLTKQPNDIEPELNAKGEHGTELEKQLENTESKRKAAKEEEEQQQQLDKVQNAYSQLRSKHSANLKELGLREKRKSLENAAKTSKTQVQRELHSKLQEMDERRQEIETLRRQLAILEESNQAKQTAQDNVSKLQAELEDAKKPREQQVNELAGKLEAANQELKRVTEVLTSKDAQIAELEKKHKRPESNTAKHLKKLKEERRRWRHSWNRQRKIWKEFRKEVQRQRRS